MNNIPNNFNEIIIKKTLANPQNNIQTTASTQFSSLLHDNENETEEITEIIGESSNTKTIQQVELENLNYLNKIFLAFHL